MDYNQISPSAFTNQNNINGMFGQQVQNTFTRNVGPTQPQVTTDPLTGRTIDPTANQNPYAPVPPPTGVQTNIAPNYDLNTQ